MNNDDKAIIVLTGFFVLSTLSLLLIPSDTVQDDLSTETSASTEVYTEAVKVSEIVTENVIEEVDDMAIVNDYTDTYFMGQRMRYSKPYGAVGQYPQLSPSTRIVYFFHRAEVWYSVKEKTGYTTKWNIPGKHVAEDGTIRDKDGYICIAMKDMPQGHTTLTSMGPGKVYDTWDTNRSIGIYTDWRKEE